MKKLDLVQMESFKAEGWCNENTGLFFLGIGVGCALAGSGIGTAAGAALLYSCVF